MKSESVEYNLNNFSLIGLVLIDPTKEQKILLSCWCDILIGEHIRGIGIPLPLPPASKLSVLLGSISFTASSCCETVKYLPSGKAFR